MKTPVIYDTTLREGMQTPGGIGGTLEERLYAAGHIAHFAHWIELGMPANNVDYQIIGAAAKKLRRTSVGIAVLARCADTDIDRAADVMKHYPHSLIHLFVGTSPLHMKYRFGGKDKHFYLDLIRSSVRKASALESGGRSAFERVMFSPEDAYNTFADNADWLKSVIGAAYEGHGRRTEQLVINLPDTVGRATVHQFSQMIEATREWYGTCIEISTHSHNDKGMANAHTLHAFECYDANWLQTTFSQLGERNGIASTETVIKTLVQNGWLTDPRIASADNLRRLDPSAAAILRALGRQPPAEQHERCNVSTAGIHTGVALKDHHTYHTFGTQFGSTPRLELGPTSGTTHVQYILDRHHIKYDKRLPAFTDALKSAANARKAPLTETHIAYEAYVFFEGRDPSDGLVVSNFSETTSWDAAAPEGKTHVMLEGTIDHEPFHREHTGAGPVEATLAVLHSVLRTKGYGKFTLHYYDPRVIPAVPTTHLDWKKRPRTPKNMQDAQLAIGVGFRNGGIYEGWSASRNSAVPPIASVVDCVSKMYAIEKWENTRRATLTKFYKRPALFSDPEEVQRR